MPSKLLSDRRTWFAIIGLMTPVVISVGGLGAAVHEVRSTHKDYDDLESCLQKHGFTVEGGWKYTDEGLEIIGFPALENFGLNFTAANGQQWTVEVIDGYSMRDCGDRVSWLGLHGRTVGLSQTRYLRLDHPDLLAALGGESIQTMEDLIAQLERIFAWAADHPDAFLASEDASLSDGYAFIYEYGIYDAGE